MVNGRCSRVAVARVLHSPKALAAGYPVMNAAGALGNAFVVEGGGGLGGAEVARSAAGIIVVTVSFGIAVGAACRARDGVIGVEARVGEILTGSRGGGSACNGGGCAG